MKVINRREFIRLATLGLASGVAIGIPVEIKQAMTATIVAPALNKLSFRITATPNIIKG